MELLKKVLKDKLFYILLVIILVINSAMRLNSVNNPDLLKAYYEASLISDTVGDPDPMTVRDSIANYALTFLGIPYKFAGRGPEVFDCSGFTCYVFNNFNIKLPASSLLQSKFGEGINEDILKKGDILLFRSPSKGINRVGHVGIVVSTEGDKVNFIHSSTGRGVVVDSLTNRYYNARYLGARRVINDGLQRLTY